MAETEPQTTGKPLQKFGSFQPKDGHSDHKIAPRSADFGAENNGNRGKIYVDVTESDSAYKVIADLPGCEKKNIEILLKENVLQIRAMRERPVAAKTAVHRSERFFGHISRALLLPNNCRTDAVAALYQNGVLTIDIQKKIESLEPLDEGDDDR